MLNWLALIPLAIFIAIQINYGWPEAKVRASKPEYAISYLMGGIMGGVVLSLIVAWIAYRAASRSSQAATIAFTAIMLLLSTSVFQKYRALQKQGSDSRAAPAAGPVTDFPVFGFSTTPPAGWQPLPAERAGVIAAWSSPDSQSNNIFALIMVQHEKATSHDVAARAGELARSWNGQVTGEQRPLDGEMAWELKGDKSRSAFKPAEGLAALHNGHFIFIVVAAVPGRSYHQELELIRQNWKWTSPESPAAHLEFRSQPFTALDGRLTLNFPAIMTPYQTEAPEKSIGLHIENFKQAEAEVDGYVQFIDLANADSFDVVKDRVGKGTVEKLKLREAFVWRALKGPTERAITQPILSADSTHRIIWALVAFEPKRVVLINFGVYATDPQEQAAYSAMAEKIVESISTARR